MLVKELIEKLKECDEDMEVKMKVTSLMPPIDIKEVDWTNRMSTLDYYEEYIELIPNKCNDESWEQIIKELEIEIFNE